MNLGHFRLYDLVDTATKKQLARFYEQGIEACEQAGSGNPYEVGVPFIWCSKPDGSAVTAHPYTRNDRQQTPSRVSFKQRDWLQEETVGVSMFTGFRRKDLSGMSICLQNFLKQMLRGGFGGWRFIERCFKACVAYSSRA
jgi:hypothetical protein